MDITPISGLPDGRPLTAAEADHSILAERVLLLSDAEQSELARLRSERGTLRRVLADTAQVLQHAADCVTSETTRNRCRTQLDRVWAAETLLRREVRS